MQLADEHLPATPRSLNPLAALKIVAHRARSSVRFLVALMFLFVGSVLTAAITGDIVRDLWHQRPHLAGGGSASALFGLFPLLLVVLGALLMRSAAREVFLPLRLYRIGRTAAGQVTKLETVANETVNGRHPTRIRYAFQDGAMGELEGSVKTFDEELIDALDRGTAVTVLYDHRQPRQNTLLAALGLVRWGAPAATAAAQGCPQEEP